MYSREKRDITTTGDQTPNAGPRCVSSVNVKPRRIPPLEVTANSVAHAETNSTAFSRRGWFGSRLILYAFLFSQNLDIKTMK